MTAAAGRRQPRARTGNKRGRGRAQCSVTGCDRVVKGRHLCEKHYMRQYRSGSIQFIAVDRPSHCTADGCTSPNKADGYCSLHYQRWQLTGDPLLTPSDLRAPRPIACSVPECPHPIVAQGFCDKHVARLYRNGDLRLRVRAQGQGHVNKYGYVVVGKKGHPLAHGKKQNVLQHRAVLYDAIGPGPHGCHWCGSLIAWWPTEWVPTRLVVDHLDDDRANNGRANLVPSCQMCNFSRRHHRNARPIGILA